jgi:mono/diheme cytochrome c family protein
MNIRLFTLIPLLSLIFCLAWSPETPVKQDDVAKSIARGKEVYAANCLSCHQISGEGLPGVYPPVAGSDHLSKDQSKNIDILLKGQNEEITVNGQKYAVPMASFSHLTDQQVADVLNYLGNNWGNHLEAVTTGQVKAKRQ